MSDHSQIIVDIEVGPREAKRLGKSVLDWLINEGIVEREGSDSAMSGVGHRPGPRYRSVIEEEDSFLELAVNGLELVTGRTVFDAGGNGLELQCSSCDYQVSSDEDVSAFVDVIDAWYEGDDQTTFKCPRCGQARLLRDWRGPWQWGFGNLGLQFWNWPPLKEEFIQAVTKKLGHQTVLVRMHL